MLRKHTNKGPSVFEVGLAAFLSVILGVLAAVVLLALKPVGKVAAIPKDAPANAVYYIEGARDFNRTPEVEEKRKRFIAGESITMGEGEMNVFLGASAKTTTAPAPGKPGDPPPDKPAAPEKLLDIGQLNCRIKDGRIQFGAPVTVAAFGVSEQVIVQTAGTFSKHGSIFVFDPDVIYLGGCPLIRVPVLRDLVLSHLLFAQPVPSDLYSAWTKLAAVSVDGNTLHLRMP